VDQSRSQYSVCWYGKDSCSKQQATGPGGRVCPEWRHKGWESKTTQRSWLGVEHRQLLEIPCPSHWSDPMRAQLGSAAAVVSTCISSTRGTLMKLAKTALSFGFIQLSHSFAQTHVSSTYPVNKGSASHQVDLSLRLSQLLPTGSQSFGTSRESAAFSSHAGCICSCACSHLHPHRILQTFWSWQLSCISPCFVPFVTIKLRMLVVF
jgi:hypothetical protein